VIDVFIFGGMSVKRALAVTKLRNHRKQIFLVLLLSLQLCAVTAFGQSTLSIKMNVDATEAARNVLRTTETIRVKPGPLTLFYPKWIPGEHSPTGPINDLVGLRISANGKAIPWRRDDVEMFAFHCDVPAGVNVLEVDFEDVSQPGTTMSARLARIKWNRVLLYPRGVNSDAIRVVASLRWPAGWKFATALPVSRETRDEVQFKEVSLTELVDSPAIIGANFRKVALSAGGVLHEMDIVGDSPAALDAKPQTVTGWQNLVKEANTLFGARHYRSYRFLLTLSDYGGSEGLEHHESSEDGVGEKALSNPAQLIDLGDLLGHEYAHSWNGKYRRPADLTTPDFEQPMYGDLLWVYEGLTQYLGKVLPARSGLWTPENFRESIAAGAADMDNQSGRRWRPLVDTATAVQITYSSPRAWMNYRRRVDYYFEGSLLWMEADVLIRQKSAGKLSLDDFCHKFHGGQDTGPVVKTYTFDDIVSTLNDVLPYDWRGFLNERVNLIAVRVPLGGISNGGWKLVYNDTPNEEVKFNDQQRKFLNFIYSLGFIVKDDGTLLDVSPESPAGKAGLAPGMKLVSINGRSWSSDALHDAIAATKTSAAPLEFLVENGSFQQIYKLDYRGGERYPHLEREAAKPDLLSEIIKPHAH
jgi:predicted metalloprotease with PDZ domain